MAAKQTNKTMGEMISFLRKEKGMTQKEIADKLFITDKAVSKWERDISCPDTAIMPKLCEILGVSAEVLLSCKSSQIEKCFQKYFVFKTILKAIAFSFGIVTAIFGLLGLIPENVGFAFLGIGLACIGLLLLLMD
ncbi:MAG: helix-turn-helix transcriptional regulator [Ruminococcaceae bacterium]|nr:helix-turn-helix transcriptional regulator [Oscillospiraceae bacterium]